jgi:vitamin B12 transporter
MFCSRIHSTANRPSRVRVFAAALTLLIAAGANAQARPGSISGAVLDPLRAYVANASVSLLRDGNSIGETTSDAQGQFAFAGVEPGRYQVRAQASGFEPQTARSFFVGAAARVVVDVAVQVGIQQNVVVTAAANELPASQVGAAVTVIDQKTIEDLAKPELLEVLRLIPGVQVTQAGARGGASSLFVRGGASNFNKVLIDGIPVNDIGGAFDYSNLPTTGVERVEALRNPNSVLYGSDALAGVVSITTRRGHSRVPELAATLDGGNLGTYRQDVAVGGTAQRFDYFAEYSHFATDNDLPNSNYRNDTFAARAGWSLGSASDLSATFHRISSQADSPNSTSFFGLSDDSARDDSATYFGLAAQSQFTARWQGVLRLTSSDATYDFTNPSPTGEAFDPFGFGANYLGHHVTIRGANGFSVSGQGILDYGGTYPQNYEANATRRTANAQTTYQVASALALSAGLRFEREEGFTDSGTRATTERDNRGAFVEARASLRRVYASAGLGYEHNAVFESAFTPRLSVAFYLREPSSKSAVSDTKLVVNVGNGIKAPSIAQENSSLFRLLADSGTPNAAVHAIEPERSRSFDAGLEQGLWQGRLRVRAAFFDNRYSDLIEYVSKSVLPQLGVPAAAAAATSFGAYVNSSTYRARGLETSAEALAGKAVRVMASYTYLDAVVSESFSSSALQPVENPAFPGIKIGQYGPLVGARPFRRPTHSGNLLVTYLRGPAQVSVAGYFVGRADDSTFLSDGFFGSSLLLPNHDLNAGYQKIDLSGSYRLVQGRLRAFASVENLLDKSYEGAFGFPALPRTFRIGVTGTIGGDGAHRP